MSEVEVLAGAGDVMGLLMNMDKGILSFFVNDSLVVEYSDVHENEFVHRNPSLMPLQSGLRPFVCLTTPSDKVTYLGLKRGHCKINYTSIPNHISGRETFEGRLSCARFEGFGRVSVTGKDGYWYGLWQQDLQEGVHLWVEHSSHTAGTSTIKESGAIKAAKMFEGGEEGKESLSLIDPRTLAGM